MPMIRRRFRHCLGIFAYSLAWLIPLHSWASAGPTGATALPGWRIHNTEVNYAAWLHRLEQRNTVAGLATAIVVGDQAVFERTLGYADSLTREPVTTDTVFRLASLSKAFAAAITAQLVQSGRLQWQTPIQTVLPSFHLKTPAASRAVTVADILGQRSGLPRNTFDKLIEANQDFAQVTARLSQVDLICPVGQCYSYQNVAYSLIGEVIQRRTGVSLSTQARRQLFQPLGMRTASYGLAGLQHSLHWARPHHSSALGWVPIPVAESYYRLAPAAGVNASLHDMERWLAAQMGEAPSVLAPTALAALHAPGIITPGELQATPWRKARLRTAYYGMGWRIFNYAGETLIYHAGVVDGYRSMIGFLPKYKVGIVTLWNSNGYAPSGLMAMVLDSLLGLPHQDWAGIETDLTGDITRPQSQQPNDRPAHQATDTRHFSSRYEVRQ